MNKKKDPAFFRRWGILQFVAGIILVLLSTFWKDQEVFLRNTGIVVFLMSGVALGLAKLQGPPQTP